MSTKNYLSWDPKSGQLISIDIQDLRYEGKIGLVIGRHGKFNTLHKVLVDNRCIFVHYYEMTPIY